MFSRMLNNSQDLPTWDEMQMRSPCEMVPQVDYDMYDDSRQVGNPTPNANSTVVQELTPIQKDINFTQGWLKTQIGKYVKIEFLIGTNMFIDREGVLEEVGVSYVVIREAGSDDLVLCDIYSIKFVRIFKPIGDRPR